MPYKWKRNRRSAKPISAPCRYKADSETTTTGTITLSESSEENTSARKPPQHNSKEDASRCLTLLKGCKEVRIVLKDLKYGNLLTQQQRRQLQPKRCRRRTSSNTSDRTKKLLNKIVKEEVDWMRNWTSSSMESLTALAYYNTSTPKQGEDKQKLESKDVEKVASKPIVSKSTADNSVDGLKKTRSNESTERTKVSRSRGRPKKRTKHSETCKTSVVTIRSTSSNSSCVILPDESVTSLANGIDKGPKISKLATNQDKGESTSKKKTSMNSSRQRSMNKSCSGLGKLSNGRQKTSYEKCDPSSSKNYENAPRNGTAVTRESNIAKHAPIPKLVKTSVPSRSEDQSPRLIVSNSTAATGVLADSRENGAYPPCTNSDAKSENLNHLHPFLQPLEKKVNSLDSIERAIEKDLAAGNNLSSNDDGILRSILMTPSFCIDDNSTATLTDRIPTLLDERAMIFEPSNGISNATGNVQNSRVDSPKTNDRLSNGKRKLPEIVKDDLLPRGTVDIASVKSQSPQNERKRRKINSNLIDNNKITMDTLVSDANNNDGEGGASVKLWKCSSGERSFFERDSSMIIQDNGDTGIAREKSEIVSLDIPEKSCNVQLPGSMKNWIDEPEIATFLDNVECGEECPIGWADALNNNRCGSTAKKNELTNSALHISSSSVRPICSPKSNLSEEQKAMLELLSTIDDTLAMNNSYDKSILGDDERRRNTQTVTSLTTNQEEKLNNNGQSSRTDVHQPKIIEKLTIHSLDRFNSAHGVKTRNETNSDFSLMKDTPIDSGSTSRRKRQWLPNECNSASKNLKDKRKLSRKLHWANGENCSASKRLDPSPRIMKSCTKQNETQEDPIKEISRETVPIRKTNSTIRSVQIDRPAVSSNDTFQKSSSYCARSENVSPELPTFGVSSNVYTADARRSSTSSASSTSSSSSSSGSSSSSSSSSSLSGKSDSRAASIENAEQVENSTLPADPIVPVPCPETIEDIETTKAIKNLEDALRAKITAYQLNRAKQKDQSVQIHPLTEEVEARIVPSNNESQTGTTNVEANAGITEKLNPNIRDTGPKPALAELVTQIESVEWMPEAGFDGTNALEAPSDCEDLEELCDAETLARLNYNVATTKENDDEDDCISLFTESLCMSRCQSPERFEPVNHSGSPKTKVPYARMKSTNIGKYMADNNRECEAILQAYEETGINAETTLKCTNESLFPQPTTTDAFKIPNEPPTSNKNETLPDLRATLNNRSTLRDVSLLFRGQCYMWLKFGSCKGVKNCRFSHSLKSEFLSPGRKTPSIEKIFDHAMENRYFNFIGLVQASLFTNMTILQILSIYGELCRTRSLTFAHVENTVEALQQRNCTLVQILQMLLKEIDKRNTDTTSKVLLAVQRKAEPGTCWDVMESVLSKVKLPTSLVKTILEEAIAKNCTDHAINVYERMVKGKPYDILVGIENETWQKFHALRVGSTSGTIEAPPADVAKENASGSRGIASPESPRPDQADAPVARWVASIKSPVHEHVSPRKSSPPAPPPRAKEPMRSPTSLTATSYYVQPIDHLPLPKCPYNDKLWKFRLDLQGIQEALRHHDYGHVISILAQYAEDPYRVPHIEGFYNILCKEITLAKHHMVEIVRRTVQSGVSDALRLYVYDLGVYVVTKLTYIGAWIHAYELIKTFEVFGQYNTCEFTLLTAQVYIANRQPSKALELLGQSRLVCMNERTWTQIRCPEDVELRTTVMDLLLEGMCNDNLDDALTLLDLILRDQCSSFKPINLTPYVEKIARILLSEKSVALIVELGRLIIRAKLFVSALTFRNIINCVFHEDRILAMQLYRYATWLGTYNRAKINGAACAHMIINTAWTEEETFLGITTLIEDLYKNIGHAVDRLKVRDLNVFLIFEVIPTERQLSMDVCDGPKTNAAWKKHRTMLKNVLDHFDPKIKIILRTEGRVCKMQSRSLVNYLKSGQIRL